MIPHQALLIYIKNLKNFAIKDDKFLVDRQMYYSTRSLSEFLKGRHLQNYGVMKQNNEYLQYTK